MDLGIEVIFNSSLLHKRLAKCLLKLPSVELFVLELMSETSGQGEPELASQ